MTVKQVRNVFVVLLIELSLLGSGCTKRGSEYVPPPEPSTPTYSDNDLATDRPQHSTPPSFVFDDSLATEYQDIVREDMGFLSRIAIDSSNATDMLVFGTSQPITAPYLTKWLSRGMKYVLGQSYEYDRKTTDGGQLIVEAMSDKQSSEVYDEAPGQAAFFGPAVAATVALNAGADAYLESLYRFTPRGDILPRENPVRHSYVIKGDRVRIDSPMVGIVQLGEDAIFADGLMMPGTDRRTRPNSLSRLSVYFHEAQHSRGNHANRSLCFAHAKCPYGHDYANRPACDKNLNGPYAIQAILVANFIQGACKNCSPRALRHLELLKDDMKSRILPGSTYLDPRPERLRRAEVVP